MINIQKLPGDIYGNIKKVINTELISQELNARIDFAVTSAFRLNRLLDRACSILSVKFKLLKTSELLHKKFAHWFPQAADFLSNFQDSRGMLTVYGETPLADFDAVSHIELFEMFVDEFIKYQDEVEDIIDASILEKDRMTESFLRDYLLKLNPYIQSAMNVLDVARMYGTEPLGMQLFDNEIKHCLTV